MPCLLATVIAQVVYTPKQEPGYCSMYGICADSFPPHEWLNCVANVPAPVPQFDLSELCPEFSDAACCDAQQYNSLRENIYKSAAVLQRCPACYQNFVRFWCEFTCSPNQAVFAPVVDASVGNRNLTVVNHTNMSLTEVYGWDFFRSCENVQFGSTGMTVMQILFGNAQDPLQFLQFQGDMDPRYPPVLSPIQVKAPSPYPPPPPFLLLLLSQANEAPEQKHAYLKC